MIIILRKKKWRYIFKCWYCNEIRWFYIVGIRERKKECSVREGEDDDVVSECFGESFRFVEGKGVS